MQDNHPPQSVQRVRGLAGLTDEDAYVIAEDGRLTVEEIAGQFQNHRQLAQLLENLSTLQRVMK